MVCVPSCGLLGPCPISDPVDCDTNLTTTRHYYVNTTRGCDQVAQNYGDKLCFEL